MMRMIMTIKHLTRQGVEQRGNQYDNIWFPLSLFYNNNELCYNNKKQCYNKEGVCYNNKKQCYNKEGVCYNKEGGVL